MTWDLVDVQGIKPRPRFGHSQIVLDDYHLLIIGGCAGPNMVRRDSTKVVRNEYNFPFNFSFILYDYILPRYKNKCHQICTCFCGKNLVMVTSHEVSIFFSQYSGPPI